MRWMQCVVGLSGVAIVAAGGCGGSSAQPPGGGPDGGPAGPQAITIKTFEATSYLYGGAPANAALVAFQDGPSAAWVALTGSAGMYQTTASSSRYAVAVGCADEFSSNVRLYYQALSDGLALSTVGCAPPALDNVSLSIDLTGVPTTDGTEVWIGGTPSGGRIGDNTFTLDVPRGPVDAFAYSYTPGPGSHVPILTYRVPATLEGQSDQTVTVDLATVGQPLEHHALNVTGLDAEEALAVHSSYATPHSQVQWPLLNESFSSGTAGYATFAQGLRQPADISNLTVTASRLGSDDRQYQRQVRHALATPREVTEALPAAIDARAPTIAWTADPQVTLTIPLAPATQRFVEHTALLSTVRTDTTFSSRTLALYVKPGWAAGEASTTITTPDLSGLAGWTADMALLAGVPASWLIERTDGNMSTDTLPVDGRLFLNSIVSGTLAP